MKSGLYRIVLIVVIILALLVMVFAGCKATTSVETKAATETTAAAETTAAKEPVKITMWWWGEQDVPGLEGYINEVIIPEYTSIHPNVTVEAVLQGTDEAIPAFKAAAQAKEGPDIATLWYGVYWYEDLWAGNTEPISDFIKPEEMDHWLEKSGAELNGKYWGVGLYDAALIIGYNKEMFKQIGVDESNLPVTWDDFLNVCQKLKDAGITPLAFGTSDGWIGTFVANYFTMQLAGPQELKKAVIGERSFAEKDFTDVWSRLKILKDRGFFNENMSSIGYVDAQQEFIKGSSAMSVMTNTALSAYDKDLGGGKLAILNQPQLTDKPVDFVPMSGYYQFITPWSKNKQEAADFLAFFHEPKIQQALFDRFEGQIMPMDDRFDFGQVSDPVTKDFYTKMQNSYKNKFFYFDYYIPWTILEAYMSSIQKLAVEDIDPEALGKEIDKAAKQWRELNKEIFENYKQWDW